MDEDEFEYDEESWPIPGRKINRADLFVLGLDLGQRIAEGFVEFFHTAGQLAAGHSNFYTDQSRFHEEAAREIETLIAGDEDDG